MSKNYYYSDPYTDDDMEFQYRHVILPKEVAHLVPKTHLMSEDEWRSIGIQMRPGWIHYMVHKPEQHVILFKRPLSDDERKLLKAKNEKNGKK